MLFNSVAFAVFLAVVLPLYHLLDHRRQNQMLLAASYVFYGWWNWKFLSLLGLSTVADFYIARRLGHLQDPAARRNLLRLSVGLNLAYLGVFKYFNFFADSAARILAQFGLQPDLFTLQVILPVGISFYTFQSISYIVDVYRNRRKHTDDFVAYALYISYFPHLVAGPIQRSTQLLPQLLAPRRVTKEQIDSGALLMLVGFFKKVAVADAVAPFVNGAFAAPGGYDGSRLLISLYLFALQIYCDFSGYTDIARGVSRLFGIELRVNFRQPYLSADIAEFWRRWHISLSEWLRDYLYIPLGGSREGRWKTYRNLMLTMLLGGLWHGAAWTFVVWGGLHGLYLCVHRAVTGGERKAGLPAPPSGFGGWARRLAGIFLTFHLVCLAWIFFRSPDIASAWTYVTGLFSWQSSRQDLFLVAFYGFLVLCVDAPAWLRQDEQPFSSRQPVLARGLAYGTMVALCLWVGSPYGFPFIYFNF